MNMSYEEARAYLEQISRTGSIYGLDTIRALMAELGNPEQQARVIHIAGTNGKGSILTYTANILKAAGYTVGTYTSPAVMGYEERYQINCEWMDQKELPELVETVRAAAEASVSKGNAMPTVFKFETAIAFVYFAKKNCDFVILETGLGGDLDSTNVVDFTEVCAFASISLDHTAILGSTLAEIAGHKAGIIKPGSAVVIGWQEPEVEQILTQCAASQGSEILRIDREGLEETGLMEFDYKWHKGLQIKLLGKHQIENAAVAVEIADYLAISEDAITEGLAMSKWPGRFEIITRDGEPPVIIDGAHNPDAAKRLAEGLDRYFNGRRIYAVIGMFKDKACDEVATILAPYLAGGYSIDLPDANRRISKEELADMYISKGIDVAEMYSIEEAIEEASEDARRNNGIVLITGSLSYLAEAKSCLEAE